MAKPLPERVASVVAMLAPLGPVRARAMFGGHGLYCEDVMFAVFTPELHFRVDGETKAAFAGAGGTPFVYDGSGRPVEMPYWSAPAGAETSTEGLLPWAELGLAAARRAAAAKKGKGRRP